jgi:hypothetical protein
MALYLLLSLSVIKATIFDLISKKARGAVCLFDAQHDIRASCRVSYYGKHVFNVVSHLLLRVRFTN